MPLTTCGDCGKEMSDSAPSCPHCGKPISRLPASMGKRSVGLFLGIGIFLLPLIFSWATLRKGHSTKARVISFAWLLVSLVPIVSQYTGPAGPGESAFVREPTVVAPKQKERIMQVDIGRLLSDYDENEVGADNHYKGNLVEVTGFVGEVKKDLLNNLYVTIGTDKKLEIPQLQAFFDDSMNSQLARLRKGQDLTVVCRIKGLMMNVLAEDCIIQ